MIYFENEEKQKRDPQTIPIYTQVTRLFCNLQLPISLKHNHAGDNSTSYVMSAMGSFSRGEMQVSLTFI
jgi:hypothetical protein